MSIMWKYLDKQSATVNAIKDYDGMSFIISNTDEEIRREHEKMSAVSSPNWDRMPHVHNPNANEDRIIKGIDKIDLLKERYRQAVEYMNWFQPAWDELSEEERFVLEAFFRDENTYGNGAAWAVMDRFHVEQATAYRKKNRALDHLTLLLYGKQ